MPRQLFAAVLVPFCYFGALLLAGLVYPGYSHISRLPSDLGAVGSPHPWIFNTGLLLTGIALLAATPGIAHAAMTLGASKLWGTLVVLALLPAAVYFILVALIPLPDPRHNALFPLLLPLQLGPFFLAFALRHQPVGLGFRQYLVGTGCVLLLLFLVALGLFDLVTPDNQGLFIRIYGIVAFTWVAVAGAVLRGWLGALRQNTTVSAT